MPSLDADYYALLRLDPRADSVAIRNAWAVEQRLWGVRQNAPDLAIRHEAERHVALLGEIKHVLLDPSRRARYDRERVAHAVATAVGGIATPSRPAAPRVLAAPGLAVRSADSEELGSVRGSFAARHAEIVTALGVGLAGGVITGSQVLHWDVALMMAIVLAVGIPVYAYDVLGLRSVAWTFNTRAKSLASWVVLIALTLYCAASVLSRM